MNSASLTLVKGCLETLRRPALAFPVSTTKCTFAAVPKHSSHSPVSIESNDSSPAREKDRSGENKMQRCLLSSQPVPAARMPYRVKVSAGKRYAWCACGHSKKQPFCDGAHRTKAPDISPLRFTLDKDRTVMLCACKQTKNTPYCDGSHFKVIFKDLVKSVKSVFK